MVPKKTIRDESGSAYIFKYGRYSCRTKFLNRVGGWTFNDFCNKKKCFKTERCLLNSNIQVMFLSRSAYKLKYLNIHLWWWSGLLCVASQWYSSDMRSFSEGDLRTKFFEDTSWQSTVFFSIYLHTLYRNTLFVFSFINTHANVLALLCWLLGNPYVPTRFGHIIFASKV